MHTHILVVEIVEVLDHVDDDEDETERQDGEKHGLEKLADDVSVEPAHLCLVGIDVLAVFLLAAQGFRNEAQEHRPVDDT